MGTESLLGFLTINSPLLKSMKVVVVLCCLVIMAMASPNPQRRPFRKAVNNRLTNSNRNPCGKGVAKICICPNGTRAGAGRFPCNGQGAPTCTCDDGAGVGSFTPSRQGVRNQVRDFLQG